MGMFLFEVAERGLQRKEARIRELERQLEHVFGRLNYWKAKAQKLGRYAATLKKAAKVRS